MRTRFLSRACFAVSLLAGLGVASILLNGGTEASLDSAKEVFELGTLEAGRKLPLLLSVKNPTEQPLEVRNMQASCGCTVLEEASIFIPPQGSANVTATVTVPHKYGPFSGSVIVELSDATTRQFSFHGFVCQPDLMPIEMGRILRGRSEEQSFTIPFPNEAAFAIKGIQFDERFVHAGYFNGAGKTVHFQLAPSVPYGAFETTIEIRTNLPCNPTLRLPVKGYLQYPIETSAPIIAAGIVNQRKTVSTLIS